MDLKKAMKYKNIVEGIFLSRPNRFIAQVEIDGKMETVHVKNTGRCKELLIKGVRVYLEKSENPKRKTAYDLIAVYKGDMLVNIDSQAPNQIFAEWALRHIAGLTLLKPEVTHGDSRFDFYMEAQGKRTFIEVKGVTLEKDGVVLFPDAPTERGVKHLRGLERCVEEGFCAMAAFIVQMERANYFCPNAVTHPEFAEALSHARENGVSVLALSCRVAPDEIVAAREIETRI